MEKHPLKLIFTYMKKFKWHFISILVVLISANITFRSGIYFSSRIIDKISAFDLSNKIEIYNLISQDLLIFALCLIFAAILNNSSIYIQAFFLPKFQKILSIDVFDHVHKHSVSYFSKNMSGRVATKANNLVSSCYSIYFEMIWGFIVPFISFVTTFFFLLQFSPMLAFICFLFSVFIIWVNLKISKKVIKYSKTLNEARSVEKGIFIDSVTNVSEVKSFANYKSEQKNYIKRLNHVMNADIVQTKCYAYLFLMQRVSSAIMVIVSWLVAIYFWVNNFISSADFILAGSLITILGDNYRFIGHAMVQFNDKYGIIADGLELIAIEQDIKDKPNAKKLTVKKSDIKFKNVTFGYKKKDKLFNDFNLEIKQGEKIGVVGKSGSGKSSFVKLLCRHHDIRSGAIIVDDKDIAQVTQDSLRKNISVIPQDVILFNRSLMENIRYGDVKASDEEVLKASKRAFADEFIKKLPDGYDSKVGERGISLSGGERQRIAIARAMLKNAPILILDEATSALDTISEEYIQKSLKELMKDKTVISIAHRLSTLKLMDRILVFENGEIIQDGKHNNLMKDSKGLYSKLWKMQNRDMLENE